MMKNRKKYIIGAGIGFLLIFIAILRTTVWIGFIEKKVNEKLAVKGWNIQIEKSSGILTGTTKFYNLTLKHYNSQNIDIDIATVNFGFIESFFGNVTFDLISIEGLSGDVDYLWENKMSEEIQQNPFHFPFFVKSFFIEGDISSVINNNSFNLDLKMGGEIIGGSKPIIHFDLLKLSIPDNKGLIIDMRSLVFGKNGKDYYMNNLNGTVMGYPVNGSLIFNNDLPLLVGNMMVYDLTIPEELFKRLPLQNKFSSFHIKFDFESDLNNFDGKMILVNDLGLDMHGEFLIQKDKTTWILKQIQLFGEKSKLTVNGFYKEKDQTTLYMDLINLDLSRWMTDQKPTEMSGLSIINGSLTKSGSLDQIDLTLEMAETKWHEKGEISLHGQVSYQDSIISTIDPVMIMIGDSYITIDGEGNFANKAINIKGEIESAEVELINRLLPVNFDSGKATGNLTVRGNFFSPSVTADLTCEKIILDNFKLASLEFNSQINVNDTLTSGFVEMKAGKGRWEEKSFDSGTISATINNSNVIINNCHFKSGKDFLQASGSFDGEKYYILDRFQLAYETHYLVNAYPISFFFRDSLLQVEPFEFHINDGMMEGVITGGNRPEGRFKMSNFNAEIITQFLNDERLNVSGFIFGEIWLKMVAGGIDMDADLSLKSGYYMEEPFEEMTLSFLFKDGILHMDDISMTRKGTMGLQLHGIIPVGKRQKIKSPISLNSTFSNLPMQFIHRFIPDFFTLGGNATGSFHLNGFPDNTNFIFDLEIEDSVFDLVEMGQFKGNGKYDGKKLIIDSAESIRNDATIKAYGEVPFDFNLSSPKIGRIFPGEVFDFHAEGQLGSLPFLSPYLSELDSVRGNVDIGLSLSGPVDALIRNGHLRINNGKVYTLLISDPVSNINGEAYMNNNQLVIENMNGLLFHNSGKYSKPKKQNTVISGAVDFTQFFNPRYELKVKSKESSFKTLYLDIQGQSNLDVTITGRDTVTIAGILEVLDANIFYEFTTEEMGTAINEEKGKVMAYQITIPIRGQAFFQNSQIDAKLSGELSLSQIGYQEMDFGGEIFVEDGSVFSYKDNFKELQGYVNFDNKGFNPIMDLNAFTMIDDERIDLRISGGLDDLDISLLSASGFSESDILELLTWGKRFEEQELTSTGFGNQTVSILGSLLENQLEKNLKESELGKLGLVDDIQISGTAGLIQGTDDDFELTAKRKIGDKTFLNLSYKRSFSLTNPNQSQIGVEYKLNRHFSVVGNIDDDGNLNLKYRYRYAY